MSLKNKASLYDRHQRGTLGPTVERPDGEGPNPSNGNFFTEEGLSDSPFDSVRGPKNDQLVKLLNKETLSGNSSTGVYQPSELDLDGVDGGNGYFHGVANPQRFQGLQLKGKDLHEHLLTDSYTKNNVTIGPSPGPSGFSDFQDLDGGFGQVITDDRNGKNFGGPYVNGSGPSDGHY
mgnify:FL=1|jgi:hypothetical protein